MPYLKRILWLAAWSVWLWLGCGLYRELPRDLGPVVCTLPIPKIANVLGFVGETHRLAVDVDHSASSASVDVFDAEAGVKTFSYAGRYTSGFVRSARDAARRGFLVVARPLNPLLNEIIEGFHRLDLVTGELRQISKQPGCNSSLHSRQPWLLIANCIFDPRQRTTRVAVVDVNTGAELFVRNAAEGESLGQWPYFFPDDERVVMPVTRGEESSDKRVYEVWRIGTPSVLEKALKGVEIQAPYSVSSKGRVVQGRAAEHSRSSFFQLGLADAPAAEVFDFNVGRNVFTLQFSGPSTDKNSFGRLLGPRISLDGRSVLAGDPMTLWDVDSGKSIWAPGSHEQFVPSFGMTDDQFMVLENWSAWWGKWLPKVQYRSTAMRSMSSGRLVVRLKGDSGNPYLSHSGELVVMKGSVHRMPFRVDWPLLTLCQTILALPLVLLWAVLHWRRSRAARRRPDILSASH